MSWRALREAQSPRSGQAAPRGTLPRCGVRAAARPGPHLTCVVPGSSACAAPARRRNTLPPPVSPDSRALRSPRAAAAGSCGACGSGGGAGASGPATGV